MHIPILTTERLLLRPLGPGDSAFIFELLNTPSWKQFIGDRNVRSESAAGDYIQKILSNPGAHYQVVEEEKERLPLGIITLIQRSYLNHTDIGFAFLPKYVGQGYAYEAAQVVVDYLLRDGSIAQLLAITLPANKASIKLLEKLGLCFEQERTENGTTQWIYGAASSALQR